ncbi:MAG: GNAT family N-acetyltransferase [Eubacteriales bacterium]
MYLVTDRLIIRDFTAEDANALYKIKYDKQVLEYNPTFVKRDADIGDTRQAICFFESVKDKGNFNKEVYYAVISKQTGIVIGAVTISILEYLGETQIGWMMISDYCGQGLASEAGKAFSDYILTEYNHNYLVVVMDVDNPASFRTALKSGFRLFEKRSGYNYFYSKCNAENFNEVTEYFKLQEQQINTGYYDFRKYNPFKKIKCQFYGDTIYDGRFS